MNGNRTEYLECSGKCDWHERKACEYENGGVMNIKEKFVNWLSETKIMLNESHYTWLKLPRGKDFWFIYQLYIEPEIGEDLAYMGFYQKSSKKFYDLKPALMNLMEIADEACLSEEKITLQVIEEVNARIAKRCEELFSNGETIDLPQLYQKQLENGDNYTEMNALKCFYEHRCSEDISFTFDKFIKSFSTDEILQYLSDSSTFITMQAEIYEVKHLEDMYLVYTKFRKFINKLQELEQGSVPIHFKSRDIADSIPEDCRTLTVSIVKEGKSLTFRVNAAEFKHIWRNPYFNTCTIYREDVNKYRELFGFNSFSVAEVVKLTYKGKTIYNA